MQNEFLNIMLAQVLQKMLAVIHVCKFFLIMVDEGTEGTVGDNLNVEKISLVWDWQNQEWNRL